MVHFDNVNACPELKWHLKSIQKETCSFQPPFEAQLICFICVLLQSQFLNVLNFSSFHILLLDRGCLNVSVLCCQFVWVFLSGSVKQQSRSVIVASPVWRSCTVVFMVVSLWPCCHVCISTPVLVVVVCLFSWQIMHPFVLSFTHCMMWCCFNLRPNIANYLKGGDNKLHGNTDAKFGNCSSNSCILCIK